MSCANNVISTSAPLVLYFASVKNQRRSICFNLMVVALSRFIDTSNWQQKDGTTLAYSDKPMGATGERTVRKRPNSIQVQVNRMSVLNETSWQVKGEIRPDSKAGYSTREYIRAVGLMDNCKIYGISLDDRQNDVFTRLEI